MNSGLSLAISFIVVIAIVILVGKRFRISARYERKEKILTPWNSLDQGIDPTENDGNK
ncbi:unannotated protein [freshwater metagenome]|jgi:hypothetical protein|uniref:Unannotated protein n=1 Tax=freshwater metagenome TaxID=449393 RepID=A0A6J7A1A6_9ZZZZ